MDQAPAEERLVYQPNRRMKKPARVEALRAMARHLLKGVWKMTHNPNNSVDQTTGQARPPKPIPLQVMPENIPAELKSLDQWVCWRYSWDEDAEKWTKYPLNPHTGNMASSTDKKTWTSFTFTYQRYLDSQSESWRFDGIGFVLTDKNGIVGFDPDRCRNPETGEIQPIALSLVAGLQTYWEVSPSGTGLRGFAFGRKPGSRCRSGDFEMYQSSRYLCITGHHLEGTPTSIEAVQDSIDTVYSQIFPPKDAHATRAPTNGTHLEYEDQLILDAARRATGTATVNRGHAATAVAGCCARLGRRPRRLGSTQAGSGTW